MLIDELKKANMQALKNKDNISRAIFSVVISKVDTQFGSMKTVTDADVINIIQKTVKELDDEISEFSKLGRENKVNELLIQKSTLQKYLPKMLSEDEIRNIISSLDDKSMPFIMKHFKTNYNGSVDMSLVSKIARSN